MNTARAILLAGGVLIGTPAVAATQACFPQRGACFTFPEGVAAAKENNDGTSAIVYRDPTGKASLSVVRWPNKGREPESWCDDRITAAVKNYATVDGINYGASAVGQPLRSGPWSGKSFTLTINHNTRHFVVGCVSIGNDAYVTRAWNNGVTFSLTDAPAVAALHNSGTATASR